MEFGEDVDLSENNPIVFAFHRFFLLSDGPLIDFSVTISWIMQLKCQMLLKQILMNYFNVQVFFFLEA